jgi:nickel-type superoxide dismutase maturation protease
VDQRATRTIWPPVAAVGVGEIVAWLVGRRRRVRVEGHSMNPALANGDHVFVRPATCAQPGQIVLTQHPFNTNVQLIKRVERTEESGLFLVGDNPPESTDSRSLGLIPWSRLIGVVTARS